MTAAWPAAPFWDFSLELYGRPGVEKACLALQDEHRLDVNLVLLAAWLAQRERRLAAPLAGRLRELGDGWQVRVMQPIREARRALQMLDPGCGLDALRAACRRALLRTELDLERLEQLQLAQLAAAAASDPSPAPARLFNANMAALYPDRALPPDLLSVLADQLAGLQPAARGERPSLGFQ